MNRKSRLGLATGLAVLVSTVGSLASATTSGKLVPSRTSGVAPLAVFFDATGSASSVTSNPFHELTYSWDFGDPSSGSWPIYQGMPSRSKNTAFGPVAAHVFDQPGTYTVKLTVQDGAGGSDTQIATITVSNPDTVFSGANTICIANSGQDFSGCPSGATQVVTNSWSTVRGNVTSGKRVLLRRGSSYSNSSTQVFSGGSVGILGAFGSGAKPAVTSTGSGIPFQIGSGMADWRVMDLSINGSGSADAIILNGNTVSQFLFYRVDTSGTTSAGDGINFGLNLDTSGGVFPDQVFFVESTATNCGNYCWYGGGHRLAILGQDMGHAGQHVIRATHQDLMVIDGNYLHDSGGNQHLLKFHGEGWDSGSSGKLGAHTYSGRAVIADNVFGEHSSSIYVALGAQNNTEDERVKDVIVERNFWRTSSFASAIRVESIQTTVRNNIFHMEAQDDFGVEVNRQQNGIEGTNSPSETIPRSIWIYNNTGYSTTSCNGCNMGFVIDKIGAPGSIAKNNLLYTPNSSSATLATGLGSWTTGNNVKATSNPFVIAAPSTQQPLGFSLQTSASVASAGAKLQSNLVDFTGALRTGTTTASVGAVELNTGGTSTALPAPILLTITPQ